MCFASNGSPARRPGTRSTAYRLIGASPSDMRAAIEGFEQSPPGAGVKLTLTQNS